MLTPACLTVFPLADFNFSQILVMLVLSRSAVEVNANIGLRYPLDVVKTRV